MVSIFSFRLLSLHILKKYAILSLEKAVLATFWASSLGGGAESAIRSSENLETDGLMFLGPLGTQINIKLRMYMKIKLNYISAYTTLKYLDFEHLRGSEPGMKVGTNQKYRQIKSMEFTP